MKRLIFAGIVAVAAISQVFADPTGREIMEMVDRRPEPDDSRQTLAMTLTDRRGKTRNREVLAYGRKTAEVDRSVMVFLSPPDVRNVGFLSYDYETAGKEDEKWLYLPAMKKVRKITGSAGNDYFMGTDFTYDDISGRDLDDFTYTFLREETREGSPCWVVETVPRDPDYGYLKILQWVHKEALVSVKSDFFDRKGSLLKHLIVRKLEKVEGYWTVLSMEMINVQSGHKTLLEMNGLKFNSGVPESLFRVSTLERGNVR